MKVLVKKTGEIKNVSFSCINLESDDSNYTLEEIYVLTAEQEKAIEDVLTKRPSL